MKVETQALLIIQQSEAKAKLLAQNRARAEALLKGALKDLNANSCKVELVKRK